MKNKIKGCLCGVAVGDALGAFYGYDAIPDSWKNKLMWQDELDEASKLLFKFRGK